ncbi:MAG: hypothetical protein ABEK50_18815 [bacterium]
MWGHGSHMHEMTEGMAHMWGMGSGMMFFGVLYIVVLVIFFWLLCRGVVALETLADEAEKKQDQQ